MMKRLSCMRNSSGCWSVESEAFSAVSHSIVTDKLRKYRLEKWTARWKMAWTARFEGLWFAAQSPAGCQRAGFGTKANTFLTFSLRRWVMGQRVPSVNAEHNKTGMADVSSWMTCFSWPCLSRGLVLDVLQRSLPTSVILWFSLSVVQLHRLSGFPCSSLAFR